MSLEALTSYYVDRLIYQYRDKLRARETIALYTKQMVADDVAREVQDAFNIDTAVGVQLDILGAYIGVPRNIGDVLPDTGQYFGFADYTGSVNKNGMADYENTFIGAGALVYLYQYAQGVPSDLDDDQYRLILKLQIITNTSDGSLYSLQVALHGFLGGTITVVDAQDMNLVYAMYEFPSVSLTVLRRFLPRLLTFGIGVVVVSHTTRVLDDGSARVIDDGSSARALIAG